MADRGEPTFLEYLLVGQLNPEGMPDKVDARYEELCQQAAFYRLVPAAPPTADETVKPALTVENIQAGLIDFHAAAEATRLKMRRHSGRGRNPDGGGRTNGASGVQERA